MARHHRNRIAVLMLSFLLGCGPAQQEESEQLARTGAAYDPELFDIDRHAAALHFDLQVNRIASCARAQNLAPLEGEVAISQISAIVDIVREQIGLCDLFRKAEDLSAAAFQSIRASGYDLEGYFAFSIFTAGIDGNDGFFTEVEVGLFQTSEECKEVEQIAREYRVPTRVCGIWQSMTRDYGSPRSE